MSLLVATGLKREAQIFAAPGVTTVASGGQSAAFEAALVKAAPGASAILSIGLAGALAPGLRPGDWVVARNVLFDREAAPTDFAWTEALLQRLPLATAGDFLGSDAMMTAARDKQAAHARTGAIAVDMESEVAARVARRLGLPFAAARVVSDAADRELPRAVLVGMRPDGGMALGAVLWSLARDPAQFAELIRTGLEAGRAFRALEQVRRKRVQLAP